MNSEIKKIKNIPKPTNFGKNLKFLRRIKGLSQGELAKHIDMSRNNIASYESGVVEPNVNRFLRVCDFFSIDPKEMLESILSENPNDAAQVSHEESNVVDDYLEDHLKSFVIQTNEMTKVFEGYKAFFEMRQDSNEYSSNRELYSTLEDLLSLLKSLIQSNWNLIQSVYPSEELKK